MFAILLSIVWFIEADQIWIIQLLNRNRITCGSQLNARKSFRVKRSSQRFILAWRIDLMYLVIVALIHSLFGGHVSVRPK
jgi:hypothetical protein